MGLGPSPMEIAVIAVIALIVIGPAKLPEAARSLGKGFREMRDSFQGAVVPDDDDEDDEDFDLDSHLADEDDEDEDSVSLETDDENVTLDTGSAPQEGLEDEDHQNDARSSVPSASSSSTERE
jgi:sec-independent protein translocase protein TatA